MNGNTLPSNGPIRAEIIKGIVNVRKTKEDFVRKSASARKILSDWAMGGAKPSMDVINEASFIIEIADRAIIRCVDQEKALRKLAEDRGIDL